MPGFTSMKKSNYRFKSKLFNEKYLVVLLLLISTITIFVILMKLPPDLQKAVNRDVNKVFMPSVENHHGKIHNEFHQHPAPPVFNDFDDAYDIKSKKSFRQPGNENKIAQNQKLSIDEKREKIKQVKFFFIKC